MLPQVSQGAPPSKEPQPTLLLTLVPVTKHLRLQRTLSVPLAVVTVALPLAKADAAH